MTESNSEDMENLGCKREGGTQWGRKLEGNDVLVGLKPYPNPCDASSRPFNVPNAIFRQGQAARLAERISQLSV